jgi:hypothetical protein
MCSKYLFISSFCCELSFISVMIHSAGKMREVLLLTCVVQMANTLQKDSRKSKFQLASEILSSYLHRAVGG